MVHQGSKGALACMPYNTCSQRLALLTYTRPCAQPEAVSRHAARQRQAPATYMAALIPLVAHKHTETRTQLPALGAAMGLTHIATSSWKSQLSTVAYNSSLGGHTLLSSSALSSNSNTGHFTSCCAARR